VEAQALAFAIVRVQVNVVEPFGVEARSPADYAVDRVVLRKEEFG
jgi:hypothetical protein